ncbi:membrane protein PM19L-like [Rutidosis leptorrhynchoides]|uniref:membrane protein PM19L-like n=1 Tax=Rutidosis leptorrhynchoides TaxID=125765 RepID=UPI003A991169
MALGTPKSAAILLLILNLGLYFIVTMIASWAINYGINRSHEHVLSTPAQIFPIFYPIGNTATGFVVIFTLIAGVVGMTTSITGLVNVLEWNAPNLHAASFSSLTTWAITLLAMGLACKEIDLGYNDANLRTLEVMMVIVGATQMFCIGAIYTGVREIDAHHRILGF